MRRNSIPSLELGHKCTPTRYLISSCYAYDPQLGTNYRVGLHTGTNSILGIELMPLRGPTHYQVSSCNTNVPQLEGQLDTKYQVGVHLCCNSILGITFVPIRASTRYQVSSCLPFRLICIPTRYQVSNWGPYGDELDTWYRVWVHLHSNLIPSI